MGGGGGQRFGSVSAPTSDLSASSSDSDPDVLPSASALDLTSTSKAPSTTEGGSDRVWRDGQWFTVLDERYLLPVFSNATASRKQATKKALLKAKRSSFAVDRSSGDIAGDDSFDGSGSPYLGAGGSNHQVNPSFSVSSLSLPLLDDDSRYRNTNPCIIDSGHPIISRRTRTLLSFFLSLCSSTLPRNVFRSPSLPSCSLFTSPSSLGQQQTKRFSQRLFFIDSSRSQPSLFFLFRLSQFPDALIRHLSRRLFNLCSTHWIILSE